MTGKEILVELMETRGMSQTALAAKLGYSNQSGVSERLRGKQDMRADTLAKFLSALDCKLIVRSTLNDKKEWIIDTKSVVKKEET